MNLDICTKLFEPFANGTLYAGFSGGADSTAALLAARRFRDRSGCRLVAIHFDHGLRGAESAREAEAAGRFAAEHDVEFRCILLKLEPGPNLEARARNARLEWWRKLAGERSDAAVVLGHHADDRAENLMLRLARGSNVSGLIALRERSVVAGVTVLRPLLRFRRAEIEAFLRASGIERWAEDSSNSDDRFARNGLRNRILPDFYALTPGSETGLFRSLDALEDDAEFLDQEAERRFRSIGGQSVMPLKFWQEQPAALRIRLLRRFLTEQSGRDLIPNRGLVERLTELRDTNSAQWIPLDAHHSLRLRSGELSLMPYPRRPEPERKPQLWDWRRKPVILWNGCCFTAEKVSSPAAVTLREALFDAEKLPCPLLIDLRQTGDRLIPFGETAPKSLKKLRIDRKIPAETLLPVLRAPGEPLLVWAPGIRHGATAPVTPETLEIIRLVMQTNARQ